MSSSRKSGRRRFIIIPIVIIGIIIAARILLQLMPFPEWNNFLAKPFSTVLTDRNGIELRVVPLDEGLKRIYSPLDEYPEYLVNIFLTAEDERFYHHFGVDIRAVLRAAIQNRKAGYIVSGASTVSMQLAGLAMQSDPTFNGKVRETLGALCLETRYSKNELLELWLSSLPFGNNIEGLAAASRDFFGIQLRDLTVEQSLLLAVIPRRPATYDPRNNPNVAAEAAYNLSIEAGIDTTLDELKKVAVSSLDAQPLWPFNAPHFVTWVSAMLPVGINNEKSTIKTSIDLDTNRILQAAINSRIEQAERYRISNGAGIIIDIHTGDILAYLGSSDFFDESNSGQIDGVQIRRQPGSTLKPFLYSMALESGYSASSILPDIPMSFGNEEIYIPQNFNQRYNGPVRLRTALSSSLNIPAVYLAEKMGVENFTDLLLKLGFKSLENQRGNLGVGMAVGNAEVTLFELAQAYAVFARGGFSVKIKWILGDNREDEKADKGNVNIFEETTVQLIQSILSDNVNRILGFGRQGLGTQGFDAMMKTGTSNQFNNIWAVGVTPEFVCAIWMGNFSGETVIGTPGSGIPADAVVEVMKQLQKGERFAIADNLHEVEICSISGGAATSLCSSTMMELYRPGEEPLPCTYHVRDGDTVQITYPIEYRNWADLYGIDFLPQRSENKLNIIGPQDGAVFFYDGSMPESAQGVPIDIEGRGSAVIYVNEKAVYRGELPIRWFLPMQRGYYNIQAESNSEYSSISIEMK
ncbi:MAG TPA: peptidoglycan glycosyltransferase [Spirochaeta sp.]|nr:peptidoglycan glycosyltransferase [Spirochaeta sp.]